MASKTRKHRKASKQTRKKCPPYAQLPETAMYLRTAKSFSKTHKKSTTKKGLVWKKSTTKKAPDW